MKLSEAAIGLLAFALLSVTAFAPPAAAFDATPAKDVSISATAVFQDHARHCIDDHGEEGFDLAACIEAHAHDDMVRHNASAPHGRLKKQSYSNGTVYVYRCPVCLKLFRRQTMNPQLNPHKTKSGWPCPGTQGFLVKTAQ